MAIIEESTHFRGKYNTSNLLEGEFRHLRDALVMLVDDEPLNIEVTQAYLEDAGYSKFMSTSDSKQAINLMHERQPDVLLLDLIMPEVSGFDILKQMHIDAKLSHIPIIVLTSSTDAETKLRSLRLGALDFLNKPFDPTELALRMRNTLAVKAHQDFLMNFDALTGLPNRQGFTESLRTAIARSKETGSDGAILQIDVSRFAQVHDTLGPRVGDSILQEIAARIQRCAIPEDSDAAKGGGPVVGRVGGNQFMVLIPVSSSVDDISALAQKILATGANKYKVGGREFYFTLSVGAAVFCGDGADVDTILKNVGLALNHARRAGGSTCMFFSQELNARALHLLGLEASLRRSLERDELVLYFQPKFDVKAGFVKGAEILLRWMHPERGLIPPAEFLQLADETGLIVPLGGWALRAACEQSKAWQAAGLRPMTLSINVSPKQLQQPRFVQTVRDAIGVTGQPEHLILELNAGSIMENQGETIKLMHQLHELGLQIALDDFGTGSSSLSFLSKCPVDELKIDSSFVQALESNSKADSEAIVGAIVAMAHALEMAVVAVGVETQEQLAFLGKVNCDSCQGYLLGKPIGADEFASTWMERRKKSADPATGSRA